MVTPNGEVQTNEDAQVYVSDLDLFVAVQLLDDTPAVQSLGKLCEDHGYFHEWASGQKPHLIREWEKDPVQDGKFRACCCDTSHLCTTVDQTTEEFFHARPRTLFPW